MDGIDVFWFKLSLIFVQLTFFFVPFKDFTRILPILFILNLLHGPSIPFGGGII
jgi:hypothetical protein